MKEDIEIDPDRLWRGWQKHTPFEQIVWMELEAHDKEAGDASFGAALATLEANVEQVVGAWVDPPGHNFFFVVETDDAAKIFAGLWPIIPAGTAQVRPVNSLQAALETADELRS